MTANPNQHWGRGKSHKCFKICDEYCSSIAGVFFSPFGAEGSSKLFTLLAAGEQEDF